MKLDKIEIVTDHKHLQIRETKDDGKYHRRVITPDMDVSKEDVNIQESAESLWTNEVKDKWATFQEQHKAQSDNE